MAILNNDNAIEAAMMQGIRSAIRVEIEKKLRDEMEALIFEAVREVSERLRFKLRQEFDPAKDRRMVYLEWEFINKKEK